MRRSGAWLWLLLIGPALGMGCGGDGRPAASKDPQVLATFRKGEVRRAEFDAFKRPKEQAQPGPAGQGPTPAESGTADWRIENIREIAIRKALAAEAPSPKEDPTMLPALNQAEAGVLKTAMTHELGWDQIASTAEEIRQQYDSHPEQYKDPEKVRVQYIFLRAEVGAVPEPERQKVRQRLEELRRQIMQGADFEEMARQHSQSSTANSGGWLTLAATDDVHPSFIKGVWNLKRHEVSGIIETPTGFQIAKMMERLPALDRKFEDVVEFARRRANADKLAAAQRAFVEEVGPRHGLERHYERLEDPFIPRDETLISIEGQRYTLQDLSSALGEHELSHLYAHVFTNIYKFLDQVTLGQLLTLEAKRLGLQDRPDVAVQIEAAVREVNYQRALDERLQRAVAEVPEEEIREYFAQNEQRYQTLRTRDLDVILLKPEGGEPLWRTLRRGEALVDRIRAGEDFAELARTYSKHYSASNGGRMEGLNNQDVTRLVAPRPWFHAILNKLKEGEVADAQMAEVYDPERLCYMDVGIIIVRLIKDTPPVQKTFEEVEELVRQNYARRNYQTMTNEIRQKVLESIALKIYEDHLPPIGQEAGSR